MKASLTSLIVGLCLTLAVCKNSNNQGFSIPLTHKWKANPELASGFVKRIHEHHQQLLGTLIQSGSNKTSTKKVHGNIELANENSFFAGEIGIGSPQQKFHVVLDTGSDYLIVPSIYCDTALCEKSAKFDPAASKTYLSQTPEKLKKKGSYRSVYVRFGSGGVLAVMGDDTLHFGEVALNDMRFGQIIKDDINVGDVSNLEGILGLSSLIKTQPKLDINKEDDDSDNDPKVDKSNLSVISSIAKAKALEQNYFSFYFSHRPENNGKFVLGGIPKEYQKGDIHWIPVQGDQLYWTINIDDIRVGDKSVDFCKGKQCTGIVDTGTTLIVGPEAFTTDLLKILKVDPKCMDISKLPDITFVLDGKDYALSASDYLVADSAARLRIEGVKTDIGDILMPTLEEEVQCAPGLVSGAGMYQKNSKFGKLFSRTFSEEASVNFREASAARKADEETYNEILQSQGESMGEKKATTKKHRAFKTTMKKNLRNGLKDAPGFDPELSFILGNVFLRRYLSVYDADKRRVGFAEALHPSNDAPIDIKSQVEDLNKQIQDAKKDDSKVSKSVLGGDETPSSGGKLDALE